MIRSIIRAIKSLIFLLNYFFVKSLKDISDFDTYILINNKHSFKHWAANDAGLKDRVLYKKLINNGFNVGLIFNPNLDKIKNINTDADIYLNPHHHMFQTKRMEGDNFYYDLHSYITQLEKIFPNVYPCSRDIKFWENKIHLHEVLKEKQIPHPKTSIVKNNSDLDWKEFEYPMIIKSQNGFSSNGLWHCKTPEDIPYFDKETYPKLLVQEFLDISFDIRVICNFGKVVSFYWRINDYSDSWRPTATQNGATVKFYNLPKAVENLASSIYEKTGCLTYGADICFPFDNLENNPLVLEFSPIYQPNPNPPSNMQTDDYASFKKKSIFNYDRKFEELNGFIFDDFLNSIKKNIK